MNKVTVAAKRPKAKQSDKVVLLILGMHRSGTSMLGGILDCLGCKGPKNKMEPSDANPKGYFESQPIFKLNNEILAAAGTRWDDWQPLHKDWLESPRFNEFRARAVEILKAEYGDASMIYLKDPRICRLLPFWQDVLEELGYRVACIHTHRHPADVVASLKARKSNEIEPSLGFLSWFRHVLDAEAASRDLPRIFTSYASLLQDWQGFAGRAEAVFGFTWPAMARTAQLRVADLVDPTLCHNTSNLEEFLRNPLVPESIRDTLNILESWVKTGESSTDRTKLEKIRRDFDLSTPLLYAPIQALESTVKARQVEVQTLTAKITDAVDQHDQSIGQLRDEKISLTAELERVQHTGTERDATYAAKVAELEGTLRQRGHEAEEWFKENGQLKLGLEALQTEKKTLADEYREERARLQESLRTRDTQIRSLEMSADDRFKEIALVSKMLLDTQIKHDHEAEEWLKENGQLKLGLEALQTEYAQAHERVEALLSSTSWRITSPLRWLVTLLRR